MRRSDAVGPKVYRRASLFDWLIDSLADHAAEVRAEKRIHVAVLELYTPPAHR